MLTFAMIVIAFIILAIPLWFLAYAIFLIKENRKFHYPDVYKRAAIIFGIFLVISAIMYYLPGLYNAPLSTFKTGDEQGVFVNTSTGDTLELTLNKVYIRFKKEPEKNIIGQYYIDQFNPRIEYSMADLYAGDYLSRLLMHFEPVSKKNTDPRITFTYPNQVDNSKSIGKKKNNNRSINPGSHSESFQFDLQGDNLTLTSLSNIKDTGHFRKI
jgi:hypothetical protein